jgi:hypothetical protein
MKPARHRTRRRLAATLVALALIAAAALAPGALGALADGPTARAKAPEYDAATLELIGSGAYRNPTPHVAVRVVVCLRHKVGPRFFDVRCVEGTGKKKARATAIATVPGCVAGRWRTSVVGETMYSRGGPWADQVTAVSKPFSC